MKKFHFRLWLLRWHRRFGLVLSIFIIWMIGTGVLLNHGQWFAWDKKIVSSNFWLDWYGISHHQPLVIANKKLILSQSGLWLGQQNLGDCALLLGIVTQPEQIVVTCSQHIWLLTRNGEVIDQIDSLRGLSQHFDALAAHQQDVLLRSQNRIFRLNTNDLSLSQDTHNDQALTWLEPIYPSSQITQERWLLDAHSGRLFGSWGVWFMDIFALLLLILVISGWTLMKKRRF